jgi:hypothetical protein
MKHWKNRQKLISVKINVLHNPLVEAVKVFLSPPHIKFSLVKKLVKAIKKDGPVFYVSHLGEEKIKEGICVGH